MSPVIFYKTPVIFDMPCVICDMTSVIFDSHLLHLTHLSSLICHLTLDTTPVIFDMSPFTLDTTPVVIDTSPFRWAFFQFLPMLTFDLLSTDKSDFSLSLDECSCHMRTQTLLTKYFTPVLIVNLCITSSYYQIDTKIVLSRQTFPMLDLW